MVYCIHYGSFPVTIHPPSNLAFFFMLDVLFVKLRDRAEAACRHHTKNQGPLSSNSFQQKTEKAPMSGTGKWPAIIGPGSALVSKVKSVKSPCFERAELHRERAQGREGASQHAQSSCTVLLCMSLSYTRSHLPLLHSIAGCVHKDQTSACSSWNLHVWHKIIYSADVLSLARLLTHIYRHRDTPRLTCDITLTSGAVVRHITFFF